MSSPWAVRFATMLLAVAAGEVAHADIYSFVDAAGVTHFSNVPVDKRYRLLLATPVAERAEPRAGKWLAKSALYDPMIDRAARSAAVRPELVRAVIAVRLPAGAAKQQKARHLYNVGHAPTCLSRSCALHGLRARALPCFSARLNHLDQ